MDDEKTEFVQFEVDLDLRAVIAVWTGFAAGRRYRAALDGGLDLAREHDCDGWLADMTAAAVINFGEYEWIYTDWMPRAAEAGVRRIALVVPADGLPRKQIDGMSKALSQRPASSATSVESFDHCDAAKAWLRER